MIRRFDTGRRSHALVFVSVLLLAAPAVAADTSVAPGEIFATDDHGPWAEAFWMPAAARSTLAAAAVDETVRLDAFPIAPGERNSLVLTRYEVYAPGARLTVVEGGDEREAPRSARLHFLGAVAGDPATRVGLSLDPETGHLRGVIDGPWGELRIVEPTAGDSRHRVERVEAARAIAGVELDTTCTGDEMPMPETIVDHLAAAPGATTTAKGATEPTHSAVIAVDTDAELLDKKFGNNTTTAADWIADLFTEMNVFYERDVELRLLQGDTTLRTGTFPYDQDPYDEAGGVASFAQLNEFGAYWSVNMSAVERVLAMLLSGKSASSNQASGIAWIDGYCEVQNSGGGYSINQVFISSFSSANIVGHELGHNFGSPHTHCYSPPVDQCYNAEGGCYTGTPSCPGGPGTVMSYCNFGAPNGAGCGQNSADFHPTVVALFDGFIASHTPGCIEEISNAEIFTDGFESGDTDGWSG
ncbi:MAG: hypothetical protein GY719_25460 [bacterium]|nr:hypothetical protein [bacterium]